MAGFIGKEQHTIDEKGRLMLPARFRRCFGKAVSEGSGHREAQRMDVLYIRKAPDRSLELYEPSVWNGMRTTISAISDFNPEERLLKTLMYESLDTVELDRQGRVPLSRELQEHAGIIKDVVIIGADTKLIIWAPQRLQALLEESRERFASLAGRYF